LKDFKGVEKQNMLLKGKIALVTGGSRGIGKAICLSMAEEGADVVVNFAHHEEAALEVVNLVKKRGRKGFPIQADVSSLRDVERMINKIVDFFGRIDILVNNAGVYLEKEVVNTSEEEWDYLMSVNLKGVFNCCKATISHMIKRKTGKIINIASFVGKRGSRGHAAYAASKAGVHAFTRSLAREVALYGICVNCVDPGRVRTDMTEPFYAKEKDRWLSDTPLGRLGTPQDVANVVVFLASSRADYITGETIEVNGGLLMD